MALYRPGPMANIPTYCAVKLGDEAAEYDHPALEPILKETFGVIIYQEQVHADRPRPLPAIAWGRPIYCAAPWARRSSRRWTPSAAVSSPAPPRAGLRATPPKEIFNACAKFAEYGFNKSHSAAYALITYQTA